jgi:predicted nucleic acid-binding protein
MTPLVVDASVAAKWVFPEVFSSQSRRLLSARYDVIAPDLIWCELGNIAWKRVRRGEISSDEAAQVIADLVRMPIDVFPALGLLPPALELAIATDRTVYDCMYLALAIDRRCRLVTADERFVGALASTPFAKYVRHVNKLR